MVAQRICRRSREIQDAHAGGRRRTRFSRALHPGPRILYRTSNARRAFETFDFPRRRTLGLEAPKQRTVVQDLPRLARRVPKIANANHRRVSPLLHLKLSSSTFP